MDNKLRLDRNENFFDFSKDVLKSIEHFNFEDLRKYPERDSLSLCNAISEVFSIDSSNVLVTNGKHEAYIYILNTFASNRDVVITNPSSKTYLLLCQYFKLKTSVVEADYDYTINLNSIDKEKDSLVILSNPNSQTGIHIPIRDIDSFLDDFKGICVIDEDYADFSLSSSYKLTNKYKNLIILRSINYSHSLAGLNFSFILSNKENINELKAIKDPHNIDTLTQIIADVAIRDTQAVRANIVSLINERIFLDNELSKLGFLVLPSKANFILVEPLLFDTISVYNYLVTENIIVKKYSDSRLKEYLRITIGTHKDNVVLVSKIKSFMKSLQIKK